MLPLQFHNVGSGDRRGERSAGREIRDQNSPSRVEQFDGFRHERDPANDEDVAIDRAGFLGERERVPGCVGHSVDNDGVLVVVGQNRGHIASKDRPFDRGDDVPNGKLAIGRLIA